ncbi:MAG TPA: dihydroneopterin aldolase [Gammaproteobacteria bacterium]|nr:dihydroneopterin aldolase [Gammaproteobacteria bacterium]
MDIIYLHDLRIDTVIGVFGWERRVRQTISLDLDMACDIGRAAASDDLQHTLDYKAVAKRLISFVEQGEFQLVETLAERVAGIVLEEFGVRWVRLRVNKTGAVRGARDVGVIIERGDSGGIPPAGTGAGA